MEQEEWRRGEPDRNRERERLGGAGEPEREHEDERRRREDGYVMRYMRVRAEGTMREEGDAEELRSREARDVK